MLRTRIPTIRRLLLAALSVGLLAALFFALTPPPSQALVKKTDGLHMSRSNLNATYYGCTTSDCADSDTQIRNAIDSATTSLGTRTIINFDNDTASPNRSEGVTLSSNDFHLVYRGYFYAPTTGTYYFATSSDDMSYVWLGSGALNPTYSSAVVKNQGVHGRKYATGSVSLQGGKWHPILVLFGERGGGAVLDFYWSTTPLTTEPSTVPTLSGSNFRHSGATFYTSISNPGTPSTVDDANTDEIAANSFVTSKSTLTFTGTTTANSYVEYSWSSSSGTPSTVTDQCSVASTTYTCTVSGYTGDTRYLRVRAYDDYSNVSSWTTAVQVEGKVLSSTDIVGGALDRTFPVQPQVQLRFAGSNQDLAGVTVTAAVSSGATLLGTTSATTDSNGLAVFSDLGFDSGTMGSDYTITYSAPGYLSATDSVRIRAVPTTIYVSTSASSNGSFVDGVWLADSQAVSTINASDLANQLAQRNVTLEAAYTSSTASAWSDGSISLDASVAANLSAERTLTIKSTKNIYFTEDKTLTTTGAALNLVLWSDSDGTNAGGVYMRASTSEFTISTNGGDLAIGGGVNSEVWNGLIVPAGYSQGNSTYTGSWWGVEFGVNQSITSRKIISTSGGSLRVRGDANSATSSLHGIAWEGGEINTGSGPVIFDGKVSRDSNPTGGPVFGVGIGANSDGANDFPKLVTSGTTTIIGTTQGAYSGHQGVFIGNADLDAGASNITITSDRRVQFGAANTIKSPIDLDVTGDVSVTSAQSWTAGADLNCVNGNFVSSAGGAITSGGDLSIQCLSVSTDAVIASAGETIIEATGTSGTVTIAAGVQATQPGKNLTLKAAANVLIENDLTLQTAGRASGAGGNLVLWSDSDASGQGFIRTKQNVTMNTIGGSTTTYEDGGHIHLAGGLDNGSTSISTSAQSGDGLPDGWAISTTNTDFGIQIGLNASSTTASRFHTGGGDLRMFGRATTASDGLALNWATAADSGSGQIELQGSSANWGLQLNRAGDASIFTTKSSFTSRSNLHPAILMKGVTTGGDMGLLGSWGDQGTDNLTIQSLGDGGIDLIGEAPSSNRAGLGFTSSAILSASGPITVNGGAKGIHFGLLASGQSQGSVVLGSCAASTCANSLVASSSANIEVIGDRITSWGSLSTSLQTTGTATFVPAVGSTTFTDFPSKVGGLTFSSNLGGLTLGRSDDASAMDLTFDVNIAGPITINSQYTRLRGDLTTTGGSSSHIRILAKQNIWTDSGVKLTTSGGDVVMWTNTDKVAGTNQGSGSVYLEPIEISTSGGKIWLAGGLDDGGVDAGITTEKGKWSTVVAGDGLPDGYAFGDGADTWWSTGVLINRNSVLKSGGGDIFIAGAQGVGTTWATGHILAFSGTKIDSGPGRIAMWGRSYGGSSSQGIALNYDGSSTQEPSMITSSASSPDAISIYSDSSAGLSWSRGITATWYSKLDSARNYQGTQIVATGPQGGITLTGIAAASGSSSANGLYLDFIDILAKGGPITLNGHGPSAGSAGVTFGWHDNGSNDIRIGAWTAGTSGAVGGGIITTPSNLEYNMTSSSSDITINTDSIWTRETGVRGTLIATSGDFKVLPATQSGGVFASADNFKTTQNTTDWSFSNLFFTATPETITIGRPTTTTATSVKSDFKAHGAISVYGSALNFPNNIINESGRGPILLKSTSTITLAANKIYQTNGSDLVLWSGSGGGTGAISIPNGACLNTNASCDPTVSVSTGNIYLGGGSAGASYPTGPSNGGSAIGISIGSGNNSGVKILSGGGNISLKGASTGSFGSSSWSGLSMVATTGSIYSEGTTSVAGYQGLRVAESGATTISSGKTSGDAIKLVGNNTSNSEAANSYGVGFLGTSMAINATGGGNVRVESSHGATTIPSTRLERVTINVTGGNIYLTSVFTDLISSNLLASAGGSIQLKSSISNYIESSTIQTSGPSGSGIGAISIWSDSDGNDTGVFNSAGITCINTIGTCSAPALDGGGDIVIGGGAAPDVTGFFPTGGSPAASSANQGIRFGDAHAAGRIKLFSGGGDITLRSKTTSNSIQGQYWHAGTTIDSGTGAISVENIAGATSTAEHYAVWIQSQTADISITSAKPTGTAISFNVESGFQNTKWSSPLLFWDANTSGKTTISATGGGDIEINATASGEGSNKYSVDMNNVEVLASSGDITIGGNRGVWINRGATGKLVTLGATSGGSATGNIVLRGNRYGQGAGPLAVKTTGTLTIEPVAGGSFLEAISFPNAATTLTGLTGLKVGGDSNTADLTVAASATIAGPITYQGGTFTGSNPLTATATGAISILSSSTIALNADLTAGLGGILAKSVGRITVGAGASALAPRTLSTAGGPISLWTTGSDAGITLSTFSKLETNRSGSAGADIVIAGGVEDGQNPLMPAGNSLSSSGTAVLIGTTEADNNVVIRAGDGDLVIRGQSTQAAAAASGVDLSSGVNLQAGTINITGRNVATLSTSNQSSGVFLYRSSSIKSVIEATRDFVDNTEALVIDSSSQFGDFAMMIGNSSSGSVADFATLRTTGENADIVLRGANATPDQYSTFLAGTVFSTNTGDVLIDGSDDLVILARSGSTRKTTFTTNSSGPGGDITIKSAGIDSQTSGSIDIQTGGTLSFIPQGSNSFAASQTFPPASSVINAGGVVVGSLSNTADLSQGSVITASGDVKFLGGAQTSNFNITTTSSGNIEFYPTTTFTKTTNVFDSSGNILIGSQASPTTSVDLGGSTLTADGSVKVHSSASITQNVAMTAGSSIELVSGQDVLIQNGLSAGSGGILVRAARDIQTTQGASLAAPLTISTDGGDITFQSNSADTGGYVNIKNFTTVTTGSGAGDILISGGSDPETGFASTTSSSGTNMAGVTLVSSIGSTVYGDGIEIDAGAGDVTIRGKANGNSQGRGVLLPLSSSLANQSSIKGNNVTIHGVSEGSGTWYGIEFGRATSQNLTGAAPAVVEAVNALSLTGSSTNYDGLITSYVSLTGDSIELTGSGPRNSINVSYAASSIAAGAGGFTYSATKTNAATSSSLNFAPTSFTSSGPVSLTYDRSTTATSLNFAGNISATDQDISVTSDAVEVGANISAGTGIVSIEPFTANRDITLGTEVSSDLSLATAELERISATTLRLGTTGNIDVTASFNLTDKVTNLALRAGGNVTGAAGVVITVANLGIDAGGSINFPGNQAASVIALNASSVTYNQSADYTVASVDGIDPEYGYGVKFAISNVPTDETLDAFMAVAFNPPPTVKILDKFDNVLEDNNLSAGDFAVTPTLTVVTSAGTPTLAGTTPIRSGGTFTFNSLNVANATAEVTLTFAATRSGAALSENSSFDDGSSFTVQAAPTFTTASYNVQAGEPTSIAIAITSTSAPAGETGFGITATLKDLGGNTIASGPHANAAITVSIAGADGTIVSGNTPATASGVADFSNLVIGGKVGTNYTLTFSVTYTDTENNQQTVTANQVVTLTPGDATKLSVSPDSQSSPTGQVLADITVSVLDAYDNLVTSSTDPIAVALSSGAGGGSAALAGYSSPVAAAGGQVVFNTLGINGTADVYTLTFSSGSLATDTHTATITHSVANRIDLVMPNSARNDVVLTQQPVVTVYDLYNNIVESFSGDITLSVDSGSLGGTVSMNAASGVADFDGKGIKLLGVTGPKTISATAASISKADTQAVALTFGPATTVSLSASAAGFVNRVDFSTQPEVTIVDSSGNPVEDFAGNVEISVSGNTAVLDGNTTISLVDDDNGVKSFSGLSLRGEVGSYILTFASTGLTDATQNVVLTHGAPTQLVIVQSAAGTRSGQVFDTPIALEVQDADGNVTDTGDGATAEIVVTKTAGDYGSGGADFGGSTTLSASSGYVSFTDLTLSGVAGDYDLSFAISSPAGLTSIAAATETVSLLAGVKNSLAIVQQPTDAEAGVAFAPVVEVELLDAWNNRVLADSTTVVAAARVNTTNTTNFGNVASVTVSSGLARFTGMNVETIGEFKLLFSSNSLASLLSESFTVAHGPASKLVFNTNPTSARSDVPFSPVPVLRLLDQYDNAVTSGPAFTVTASVISANSGDVQSFTGNQQSSNAGTEFLIYSGMNLKAPAGTYKLRYTATDGTNTFFIDSADIALGFGFPSQLSIATQAASARAGEAFGTLPVIEIRDSAGNIVADSTLRVTASVAGRSLVGTDFVDAVSGVADFASTGLGIAGVVQDSLTIEYEVEYPAGSFITASQSIDLLAGPTRYLFVAEQPTELVTRGTFSPAVTVELRDQYQNLVLSDSTSTVSAMLYASNNQVAPVTAGEPALQADVVTAANGVADFSALSYAVPPGTGYYIKFSLPSSLDVVDSDPFTVVPGAVTSIAIDQQPSTTKQDNSLTMTGELLEQMPQVSLYDQDGYLADNAVGSVAVSIASGSGGDLSEGLTSAEIASGVAVFSGVKLVGTPAQDPNPAESYTLRFSFAGVDSAASDPLSVTHNVAHQLVLQRAADGGRAGEAFTQQPIVEIQDRYGNIVESSNVAIRAGVSPGNAITGREVNASSGVARFTSLAIGGLTTNTYTLTFEIPNTSVLTATQSGISLTYGVADRLEFVTAPASIDGNGDLTKTGDPLYQQPVLEVRDAHGNRVENSNDIVTVSFTQTFDARDRLENEVVQAVNGLVTFQNLKLIARPGLDYRLSFDSGQLGNKTSEILQVRHADPDSIEITAQPGSLIDPDTGALTRTGNALHSQPEIRILDFDGNHADSAAGVNVTATVVTGGGTALTDVDSSGRPFNEAEINAGSATFSELKVVAIPGVPQEIQFSASFPTGNVVSVNSSAFTLTNALAQTLAMEVEPCAGNDDGVTCAVGITGNVLTVQPTIKILDAYGNLVVDHVGEVIASVSASDTRLSVTDSDDVALRTVSVSGGYAAFAGLELTAAPGAAVKINFASAELAGVSSRDLIVAAANAASLEMVVQPVGERTGNELSTQPKLRLVDRFGNTVLSDSTTEVTVSASGGDLFTDPSGPLTAVADEGIVSFAGLRFTGTPGASYELTFTAPNVISATSASFSVTNAFANNLVITRQPVAGKTGDMLTQMPQLELRDFDDNLAEDDNSTVVTVSIDVSNGAASFVDAQDQPLGAAPTATAIGGVVDFSDLRIVAVPGTVYKLGFEATPTPGTNFSSPASAELVFSHANPAQLVVIQSAIGGLAGSDLTTQPALKLQDRFGNDATTDNATVVTALIETGASGDVLRGATVTANSGVVTFTELALDGVPAQTYTLGFHAVSEFGDSFRVVDGTELSLSRPATLSLSFTDVAYVPDLQVVPVFVSDSQGDVTWSTTADPGVCVLELDGSNQPTGNVIVKGVGTCSLKAEVARFDFTHAQAPQSAYLANEVAANLVITKAAQASLEMSSADNVDYRSSLTLAVTGGSGTGDLRFFVTGDCRVIGGVLLPGEAGAFCEVFARKLGDANYEQIDSPAQVITINRIGQSALRIANSRDVAVGDIVLFTSGGTGTGEVTFQVSTQGDAQCQIIDGNILRATQNGNCGVMATKQQSTNYLIAISPEATFTFSKMSQTVNFTSSVPTRPMPGMLFEPAAVASSGLPVTISITGGAGTVCEFDSVETSKVRFLTSGNCVLTASQSGSSQFNAASATITLAVNALNQTITFGPLSNKTFGEPKFQLNATASSGLPVSFSLGSSFQNLGCSVTSMGMVTLTAAGMCEIVASQPGDASYLPAPDVTQIFSIAPDQAGAPHLVSVSVSNQAITAKFRAPSYLGGSQVSAYRLEAIDGNDDTYVNPGCSPTGAEVVCDLVGMPLNVSYTIRVAAVTAAGIGVYSDSSLPVTPGNTEIAVMKLSADQDLGSSELNVSWEKPLALDGNFVEYQVFVWPLNTVQPEEPTQTISTFTQQSTRFTMEAEPEVQPLSIASFSLLSQSASVPEASSYNLKVVTITDASSTAMTDVNVASGVQLGLGVPGRPRNEILEADNQQLRVVWSEPNFDGGSEITHYMIRKAGEEAPPCSAIDPANAELSGEVIDNDNWNYSLNEISALLYEQSGLSAGSTYEIAIFACNSIGASAPAILTHSIPAPPPPSAPVAPVLPEEEEEVIVEDEPEQREEEAEEPATQERPTQSPAQSPTEILNPEAGVEPTENPTETPGPVVPEVSEPEEPSAGIPEVDIAKPESETEPAGNSQLLLWILLALVLVALQRISASFRRRDQ